MKALSPVMPITLASLLLLGAAQAQDSGVSNLSVRNKTGEPVMQTVNVLENEMIGRIDWENKVVYAVGDGVPPIDAVNPAQSRVRAKRAAIDETIARPPGTMKERSRWMPSPPPVTSSMRAVSCGPGYRG